MALAVHEQTEAVKAMAKHWPMIESLLGGTQAMRDHWALLPREDRESTAGYSYRAQAATLYPALARTVGVMSGKPFSKQITLGDDVPPGVQSFMDNIDAQGRNLHAVAYDVFEEALSYGLAGVLVDTQRLTVEDGSEPTQADIQQQGIRPYFAHIKHGDILGWKTQLGADGLLRLSMLRIREEHEFDDGPYGTSVQEAVRVLTPGAWELWRKTGGDGGYTLAPEDQGATGLPEIPFVPFYGRRLAFMTGESPLLDLAYLNVKHYQVQSDQDDSARFARKRLLVFIGVEETRMSEIEASSSSAIVLGAGADVKVVQGSAESVTVGRNELNDLEEQMVRTGAELLVMKPGGQRTATQDNNEAEGNRSELQRMVEGFEDALDMCLQYMAMFLGEPQGGHVSMFKDFGASNLSDASADLILKLQQAGLITKETALREQQRRGLLSADIDPETELEDVEAEGPALGEMGVNPLTGLSIEPPANAETPANGGPMSGDEDDGGPMPAPGAPEDDPQQPSRQVATVADSAIQRAMARPITPVTPVDSGLLARHTEIMRALTDLGFQHAAPATINITMPEQPAPIVNINQAPVQVDGTVVNVSPPSVTVEAPIVNVSPPAVTVESTVVNVEAPIVNVSPAQVVQRKATEIAFETDAAGDITGAKLS